MVAASAARWNERVSLGYAVPAFRWLERQQQPQIHAVGGIASENPYRLYVPDNVGDKVAKSWVGGREASIAEYRAEKDIRPTHLSGEAVHYLYPLPEDRAEFESFLGTFRDAARSITHLGWGIDMVVANADVITDAEVNKLPGHCWRPVPVGGVPLRVPKTGTLDDLVRKHTDFLGRLSADGFKPVPPLSCFDVVQYYSPTVAGLSPTRPFAAFEIHRTIEDQEKPDYSGKSKFRPFHHVRRVATVAGMVRHASAAIARKIGWPEAEVQSRIEGHGDQKDGQATSDDRFLFLPLPSMTRVGVSGIRRVLVVAPPGFDIAPLRRQLNGEELIDLDTSKPVAMLSGIAVTDKNVGEFVGPAKVWSTVTPVILPGYDDPDGLRAKLKARVTADEQKNLLARLDARIMALIWKAFHQAGWTPDALAEAEVEYRPVGWFRGLDLAKNYDLPPLKYPRYHLRVRFPRPVRGPLAIGAGRYRGFGLFAVDR
jgi:CRISPR-associated protein Csb2